MDGMDSGPICGQRSWDAPNNAMSVRAGPFMCRMRADEENTIMPESGEERRGCAITSMAWEVVCSEIGRASCRERVENSADGGGSKAKQDKDSGSTPINAGYHR